MSPPPHPQHREGVSVAVGPIHDLPELLELSRANVPFVSEDSSSALFVLVRGEPENVDEIRVEEILSEHESEVDSAGGGVLGV